MGILPRRRENAPGRRPSRITFAPGRFPRYAAFSRCNGQRAAVGQEERMGANLAIVTLVVAFSLVIGIVLGRKLRRK
jgi:hypothetical protein